jgi:hypothetical protein
VFKTSVYFVYLLEIVLVKAVDTVLLHLVFDSTIISSMICSLFLLP